MLIRLKPISSADLGEIVIDDCLFAVGRHELPFVGYDPALTEKLSRRHARLFIQNGGAYLADLGSLNGTTVGGRRIGKDPLRLQDGDEICFAGLCYRAELRAAPAAGVEAGDPEPQLRLVLRPEYPQLGLEPIVVTEFPFLVNKTSEVFTRYKEQLPTDVSYLSRRHAHIFIRNNQLYLEDLGSTNGTYLDGERLDEHARPVTSGQRVAFGGDRFAYRVDVISAAAENTAGRDAEISTQLLGEGVDLTKTTFVTTASSFLEIFCCEDAQDRDEVQVPQPTASARTPDPQAVRGWRGLLGRAQATLGEIRRTLADEPHRTGLRSPRLWAALAGGAVLAIVATAYLSGVQEREIRHSLERDAYREAAVAADRYLRSHPNDYDIGALASEALLKETVPAWMELLASGDYVAAGLRLGDARKLSTHNAEGNALLDLLTWVTGIEAFISERGGADAPVVMFAQEARINALLDAWEPASTEHRHRLESIARYVPAFSALRAQVFSHLRTLRSLKALDLEAIDRLLATLSETLDKGDPATLPAVLSDFKSHYPRISGVEKLLTDLQHYLELDAARKRENWIQAYRLAQQGGFQTPPFRERVGVLLATELPDAGFIARDDQAMASWRQGELDAAVAALEALVDQPWGKVAQRQLERCRRLKDEYAALRAAQADPAYEDRLLTFYNELDAEQDRFLVQALADEMQRHGETALQRAGQSYAAARTAWGKYRNGGGIRGLQRLEPNVSPGYREMATLLSDAYQHISQGVRVCTLLKHRCPPEWTELDAQITNEIMLQRRSLGELAMVLEPTLNKAKLDLLPVPSEQLQDERRADDAAPAP